MSIQISIIIWTIICFLILMLILKKMLFNPIFQIIEQRNLKIEKARQKKIYNEELIKQAVELNKQKAEKVKKEIELEKGKRILEEQNNADITLKNLKTDEEKKTKDFIELLDKKSINYKEQMTEVSIRLAETFASRIVH